MRAARVRGDVAADLRLLGGAGIGREEEPVLAGEAAHVRRRDAGFDFHPPEQRIDRADAAQPLEPEDDAAERHRAAREAGAAATGRDRGVVLVAPGDHLRDLGRGAGEHDGVGAAAEPAGLGRILEVLRWDAVEHQLLAEAGTQLGSQAHAARTGFVSEPTPSISIVTSSPAAR